MNSFRLRPLFFVPFVAFSSAVFAADPEPVPLPAQVPGSALEALKPGEVIPTEIIPEYRTSLSFSVRKVKSGPVVHFGRLGSISPRPLVTVGSDGVSRTYDDGAVATDAVTAEEQWKDGDTVKTLTVADGTKTNLNGTKSYVDASGIVHVIQETVIENEVTYTNVEVKKFRAYDEGKIREWRYSSNTQFPNGIGGQVAMSNYGTFSEGGSAQAESRSGEGVDMQLEYRLGRIGKHLEYGISGGGNFTTFNAKTKGIVLATMLRMTDTYLILDVGNPDQNSFPKAKKLKLIAADGTVVKNADGTDKEIDGDFSETLRLQKAMLGMEQDLSGGPAVVEGFWQLKGAYLTMRLGPALRFRFNQKYAISANAGFACTFIGATFRAEEELISGVNTRRVTADESKTTQDVVSGYYADVNAEYWLTERTGFQFGMGVQELGKFKQKAHRGRTAEMDLGSSRTWKLGMITRF